MLIKYPTLVYVITNPIRSIIPNKCHASVSDTNQREEPKNFSPFLESPSFHLLGEDIAFIQYLEGLNLILPSSDKSATAFAKPVEIASNSDSTEKMISKTMIKYNDLF